MPYLLDSNVFIEAKNRHYGFDFCPAFWDWIIEKHRQRIIFSIDKVRGELIAHGNHLSTWVGGLDDGFFIEERESLPEFLGGLSTWATNEKLPNGQPYREDAIAEFFRSADYFLVGHALDRGFAVVTHEVISDGPSKIKVPNACRGVGVRCLTPYDMLREQHARFVLPGA